MKKAVIFDIDGVLAEKSPERDYREYDKVDLDKGIYEVFVLLEMYIKEEYSVLWVTGRKNLCREKTVNFLYKNMSETNSQIVLKYMLHLSVEAREFMIKKSLSDSLFMRADSDHRKAVVLKKEIYETHIKGKYDIVACFDDDPEICEMYKKEGILTFEVKRNLIKTI